jgi:hypothetical protein
VGKRWDLSFSVTRTRLKGGFSDFLPDLETGKQPWAGQPNPCSCRWSRAAISDSFRIRGGF